MQKHSLHIDEAFELEAGGTLKEIDIVYHTSGGNDGTSDGGNNDGNDGTCDGGNDGIYDGTKPVVWIYHALTANSDAEDWWPTMVGAGKAIDTDRYFVCCVNMLGSCYGSTCPLSINPTTGKPYMLDWPKITNRDNVRVNLKVMEHLGIEHVDLLVGSSIGGFQAVEMAVMAPEKIRRALFIATGVRINAWISATLEAQRMAIEADATYREARDGRGGRMGLRAARAQALLTYRSFDGYVLTQSEKDEDTLFPTRAASYERHQGDKLMERFDAYSYMSVIDSADSQNVGRNRGGIAKALSGITAKTVVVAITSDGLFPPKEVRAWAQYIPGAEYVEIESDFGHDGFLLETEQLRPLIPDPC